MDLQKLLSEILDYARGMWRYRWHLVVVAWLIAIPGWVMVYKMPDMYEASAQVSVDTNSLLPALTKGLTASEDLMDDVALVSRALLTRPNLAEVARETDLDLRATNPREMESLITTLQRRVSVRGGRDKVFQITYKDPSREKAREVVASLLDTFVESSLGAQGDDAEMTGRALKLEIDDHESRLLKAEAELAEFKKQNIGYMPSDSGDYYTRLQVAMEQVDDTAKRIRLVRQRRDEIVRQLEGETPILSATTTEAEYATTGCSRAQYLVQLKSELSALRVDYTDKHPRIVMLKETIADMEATCEAELESLGGNAPLRNNDTQSYNANPVYQNLRLQLSETNVELAALQEEMTSYRSEVAQLRTDVDKIADVETELKKLNRDYGVIEARHQELLRRWETLQSKKRIDPVTDKVQFNILEPPFASADPVAPNRPLLLVGVLVIALGAGGATAFGLSQLKPVYFHRRTLAKATGVPVLGSVSLIMSPDELLSRRIRKIAWIGANVALLFAGAVVIALEGQISSIVMELFGGKV